MNEEPLDVNIASMDSSYEHAVLNLLSEFIVHEAGLDPNTTPFVQDRVTDPNAAAEYLVYCHKLVSECEGTLQVALNRREVAGFLCWVQSKDGVFVRRDLQRIGEVIFPIVGQRFRRLGIGHQLMLEAERLTKEAGLHRLSLMVMAGNRSAVSMYDKLGFRTRAYKMLKSV